MLYRLIEEEAQCWGDFGGEIMPYDELVGFLVPDKGYFADWASFEAEEGGYAPTIADYTDHLARYGFVEKVAEG